MPANAADIEVRRQRIKQHLAWAKQCHAQADQERQTYEKMWKGVEAAYASGLYTSERLREMEREANGHESEAAKNRARAEDAESQAEVEASMIRFMSGSHRTAPTDPPGVEPAGAKLGDFFRGLDSGEITHHGPTPRPVEGK